MFLRDKAASSPWLPGGHRWSNSSWATPCDRFGKPKANPSSLQRRLGGPATIPRLAQPVTTHKVPAWTTFLGIALFGLALFWLHHLLGQYRWRDILAHVHAISTVKVWRWRERGRGYPASDIAPAGDAAKTRPARTGQCLGRWSTRGPCEL